MGKKVIVKNTGNNPYVRGKYLFPPGITIGPIQMTERDIFGMKTTDFLDVTLAKSSTQAEKQNKNKKEKQDKIDEENADLKDLKIWDLRSLASKLDCDFTNKTTKKEYLKMIKEKRAGD